MHIWGKVLGFLFGFMISKTILGALLGLWLGHRFDKGLGLDFSQLSADQKHHHQVVFFYTSFAVMGHVAKAKGRVSQHEIAFAEAYMNKLGLNSSMRQQAKDAFREGKMAGFPLMQKLDILVKSCGHRRDLLLLFMEIQIQVAFADGTIEPAERKVLHTIAARLGFSRQDLEQLLDMIAASAEFHRSKNGQQSTRSNQAFAKSKLHSAYQILGITETATEKEIKTAYRKLMAQHHPDKLVAKGLPPEMMEVAKQKTQEIQAAYDLINRSRTK